MTLKELGSCDHVRRVARPAGGGIEFRKDSKIYHALCPKCGSHMRWDNWTNLSEPLRAKCPGCGLILPSTELNLQPTELATPEKPHTENDKFITSEGI